MEIILTCAHCGKLFCVPSRSRVTKYCSHACYHRGRYAIRIDPLEQLLRRVTFLPGPNGCWIWTGARNSTGYGTVQVAGKTRSTHWLSYHLFRGRVDPGLCICHACDTPACVNPDHLWLGTHRENMRDMTAKGRKRSVQLHGSRSPRSLLNEDAAAIIRTAADAGHSVASIARAFQVSQATVRLVVQRVTWKHVP